MLDFTTIHRFVGGKLIALLETFGLSPFTLDPFLASTSIVASSFSVVTLQLIPAFNLDPFLTFRLDLTFLAFINLGPFLMNSFIVDPCFAPLDHLHQVVVVIALQHFRYFE